MHNAGSARQTGRYNNWQPRLGVAYNFRPKWVFRGNFGIITADLLTSTLNNNFEEYLATANVQAPPGRSAHRVRALAGPAVRSVQRRPGRLRAVHRDQLQRTQRHPGSTPTCACRTP